LELTNGNSVRARTVVVASGARYRRPLISNLSIFEGAGVSYWASPVEAKLCEGEEVALVGEGTDLEHTIAVLESLGLAAEVEHSVTIESGGDSTISPLFLS
jgi:thioredoxin reductase (NADPH)